MDDILSNLWHVVLFFFLAVGGWDCISGGGELHWGISVATIVECY